MRDLAHDTLLPYMLFYADMTRTLHLIKHGKPFIIPGVPGHEWQLASDALDHLPELLEKLQPKPQLVVCSMEPKAQATALALAEALGVPFRPMLGLHEHLRYTNEYTSTEEFQARFQRFFAEPDLVVVGEESARDALTRFRNAVKAVMQANAQENVAIVSHGTVISLLVAEANGLDPFPLWQSLKLLDAVSVEWPTLKLL